jgi:uncharacterized protein (DUF2141 family)
MKLLRLTLIISIHLLVFSCARQTSPTGGPKDTIPPNILETTPIKGQTKTKPSNITLLFDEAVILNNPKEQILITPDLQKKYQIEAKNKTVQISLETELLDNTTYLFNFRDAIQDITEKNPARDLKLAFSTGVYIDSLKISGTIRDLLKNSDTKDATVALYQSDTFNIFQHRPAYITRTNDKGQYLFEYLKNGTYYIYAFDDKNKNLTTDSKSESFAFKRDSIVLQTNKTGINMDLIRLDSRAQKLTSTRPYNTYTTINFIKGLLDYKLSSPNTTDSVLSTYGDTRASIQIYNTFAAADSILLHVQALDSINHKIDTTVYVKFSKRETEKEKFSLNITDIRLTASNGLLTAKGTFTKPIFTINKDSLYFRIDSVTTIPINPDYLKINNQLRELTLNAPLGKSIIPKPEPNAPPGQKPPPPFELRFGKGSFISIENDSSASIKQNINPLKVEDLGVLKVVIETKTQHYILDLLTKDYKLVATRVNPKTVTFDDLTPGDYIIRITLDHDQNGKWSPGNYDTKKEAEPFVYYLTEKKLPVVTLKANWELGPLLIRF